MTQPIIVFDLDGTLVDTAPDLVGTLNVILTREGFPPLAYETARNLVGGGARQMLVRGIAAEGRALSESHIERLYADFLAHYREHVADRSRPFPGVTDALDRLAEDGYVLAVCTNKLERLAVQLLQTLGLAARFAAICGQDTFDVQKPHPDILRKTIAAAGGDPQRAIMVGDSLTDVRTARAAGIPIVAVDFGYSEIPVRDCAPDRLIGHFSQLIATIAALSTAH